MAKDASNRYPTGQELAADLRRFLEDRPVLARRPRLPERTIRWARRHRELVATASAILVLALTVSTAAIWVQARKTEAQAHETERANQRRIAFVIDSYSLLHQVGTGAIMVASAQLIPGRVGSAREEATQTLERWLRFFQQAIELPPNDRASRTVIARAYSRLGYTHWMLSYARGTGRGLEPRLLAQALDDYRRSVKLLEELLAESPGDPEVRRYLAEALGLGNMGCCLRSAFRTQEAELFYRRAIQVRHELLRGACSSGVEKDRTREETLPELDDLLYLVSTVHLMARILEGRGLVAEAEALRRQLEEDVVAVTARLSDREFQDRRQMWAARLSAGQLPLFDASQRRDAMINQRLALLLDPENPAALNNLAWTLACMPGEPWFDPQKGLALARKAVAIEPNEWSYLNTLGVAAFRAHDWDTAARVFHQSTTFTGGGAYDFFFLAMTYWHQGSKQEARRNVRPSGRLDGEAQAGRSRASQVSRRSSRLARTARCPRPHPQTNRVIQRSTLVRRPGCFVKTRGAHFLSPCDLPAAGEKNSL